MTSSLERAAKLVRDHVDAPPLGARHAVLRARLVDEVQRSTWPAKRIFAGSFAVAAAAAVIALVLFARPKDQPLTFVVGRDTGIHLAGTCATPNGARDLSLRFSDGSQLVLDPEAAMNVVRTTTAGASLVLERGRARFDIVHRSASRWTVSAGPYVVNVIGTQFSLAWDPKREQMDLSMQSGVVVVRGPGAESGVEVRDQQRMTRGGNVAQTLPPDPSPGETSPAPVPGASRVDRTPSPSAKPRDRQIQPWSELATQGKFDEILADADRRGVESALETTNDADLMALADAARYSKRPDLAKRALLTVRARFAGTARSASAAFLLGRISDEGGDPSDAVRYYDRYTNEAPTGPLAPEAFGRRILALQAVGDREAARTAAEAYLERFPTGPYAALARKAAGR